MIHISLLENLYQYIRDNHHEIVSNPESVKSVWRRAGELSLFENDARDESVLLLQTLTKYGIYDFPFWLQRDVLIPLFEKNASASQKEKYLSKMRSGETICALAITEETGGSSLGNITSQAQLFSGQYCISCKKNVVTNAQIADVFFLIAQDEQGDLSLFFVEKTNPNVKVQPMDTAAAIAGLNIGMLECNAMKLAQECKIGSSGSIKFSLNYFLSIERFCCASLTLGFCHEMFKGITDWIKGRDKNRSYNSIWAELSKYWIAVSECDALYFIIENNFISRKNLFYDAAKLKYSCVNLALKLSSDVARISGHYSINRKSPLHSAYYIELAHAYAAAGGTQEVMLQIAGNFIQNHV